MDVFFLLCLLWDTTFRVQKEGETREAETQGKVISAPAFLSFVHFTVGLVGLSHGNVFLSVGTGWDIPWQCVSLVLLNLPPAVSSTAPPQVSQRAQQGAGTPQDRFLGGSIWCQVSPGCVAFGIQTESEWLCYCPPDTRLTRVGVYILYTIKIASGHGTADDFMVLCNQHVTSYSLHSDMPAIKVSD